MEERGRERRKGGRTKTKNITGTIVLLNGPLNSATLLVHNLNQHSPCLTWVGMGEALEEQSMYEKVDLRGTARLTFVSSVSCPSFLFFLVILGK